jgi:hypothetical protein
MRPILAEYDVLLQTTQLLQGNEVDGRISVLDVTFLLIDGGPGSDDDRL